MSHPLSFKNANILLLILLGIVVFSDINVIILNKYLGIASNLPEILFLPFALLLRKSFKSMKINVISLIAILCLWSFLCYLGNSVYLYGSIFSHARGFLYIFIFCLIFKDRRTKVEDEDIFYIVCGALLGWLICCLVNRTDDNATGFTYGNLLAVPLFLCMTYVRHNRKLFYFGIVFLIVLSILSGLRRLIIIYIASLLLVFIIPSSARIHPRKSLLPILFILFISIIIYFNIDKIARIIYIFSPIVYYRIIEKTTDMMVGTAYGDDERIGNFDYFLNHFSEELFPSGFIKSWSEGDFGRFNDFPIFQLSYTFGIVISAFLIIYILYYLIKCLPKTKYRNDVFTYVVTTIIMFILLFLDGDFLVSPIVTPFTGLCLGKIMLFQNHKY